MHFFGEPEELACVQEQVPRLLISALIFAVIGMTVGFVRELRNRSESLAKANPILTWLFFMLLVVLLLMAVAAPACVVI